MPPRRASTGNIQPARSAFLDTSGWLAALNPREGRHKTALAAYRQWLESGIALVTTNLVIAEMHILVSRSRGVDQGIRFLDSVRNDAHHEIVHVDRDLERAAIERWIRPYSDKTISIADATSFEVMRERGLRQALSLDHHFVLAGFEIVP